MVYYPHGLRIFVNPTHRHFILRIASDRADQAENMQQHQSHNMVGVGDAQPVTPQPAPSANYALIFEPLPQEPYINDNVIREGEWEAGLLGCFSSCVPNCLMSYFVPCVSLAQISSRIGIASYTNTLIAFLVVCTLQWVFAAIDWTVNPGLWGGNLGVSGTYMVSSIFIRFTTWTWLSLSFNTLFFIGIWQLRFKIRQRFHIPGNACADALTVSFCSWCAIAQMATHVKSYRPGTCDFGPVDTLPAYQPAHDEASSSI